MMILVGFARLSADRELDLPKSAPQDWRWGKRRLLIILHEPWFFASAIFGISFLCTHSHVPISSVFIDE